MEDKKQEETEVTKEDIKELTKAVDELNRTIKLGLARIVDGLRYIR